MQDWYMGWFSLPASVFWVILVMNAINLIDGLDGLAAGVSFFVCIVLIVLCTVIERPVIAVLLAALAVLVNGIRMVLKLFRIGELGAVVFLRRRLGGDGMTFDAVLNLIALLQGKGLVVLVVMTLAAPVFIQLRVGFYVVVCVFLMGKRGDTFFMLFVSRVVHLNVVQYGCAGMEANGGKQNTGKSSCCNQKTVLCFHHALLSLVPDK
jgi:hypothetical protein